MGKTDRRGETDPGLIGKPDRPSEKNGNRREATGFYRKVPESGGVREGEGKLNSPEPPPKGLKRSEKI